jgi:hypothetical protein
MISCRLTLGAVASLIPASVLNTHGFLSRAFHQLRRRGRYYAGVTSRTREANARCMCSVSSAWASIEALRTQSATAASLKIGQFRLLENNLVLKITHQTVFRHLSLNKLFKSYTLALKFTKLCITTHRPVGVLLRKIPSASAPPRMQSHAPFPCATAYRRDTHHWHTARTCRKRNRSVHHEIDRSRVHLFTISPTCSKCIPYRPVGK